MDKKVAVYRKEHFNAAHRLHNPDRPDEWNREHETRITMPELALRFILGNEDVSTIIPGMRKLSHVESNIAASDAGPLPRELQEKIKGLPLGTEAHALVTMKPVSVDAPLPCDRRRLACWFRKTPSSLPGRRDACGPRRTGFKSYLVLTDFDLCLLCLLCLKPSPGMPTDRRSLR